MPLNAAGEIAYKDADVKGGTRFQDDPPVCTYCKQEITRENFGWAYVERQGGTRGKIEIIECKGCTRRRAGGTPLLIFLERHGL